MGTTKVGVQLHPQHTSMDDLRAAWRAADELGVDSIWLWDHFFPLFGPADGEHFEAYTTLAAMAVETTRSEIGILVTCNSYRNPELLADMARTVDHLSVGRFWLGIGSGWFERDYTEYGYEFGTAGSRLRDLEAGLERIEARFAKLNPAPVRRPPILIGGSGETVTLRLVATYADGWNTFGPAESWSKKNAVLDEWCDRVGRDPTEVERTVAIRPGEHTNVGEFVDAGADHVILMLDDPFDLTPVRELQEAVRGA